MTDSKGEIVIDFDGYFPLIPQIEKEVAKDDILKIFASEETLIEDLKELYYLEIRSAFVITGSESPEKIEAQRKWQKLSYKTACAFTSKHLKEGHAITPFWIDIYKKEVHDAFLVKYPKLGDIQIIVTIEPRFYARAINNTMIKISALTRVFLRQFNMIIWSIIQNWCDNQCKADQTYTQIAARIIIPHLIYSHDFIPMGRLPYTGIESKELSSTILMTTKLQLMYIIAHEYAHIILGHLDKKNISLNEHLELEIEADRLALITLLEIITREEFESKGDVWTAFRWVYQYQILDEIVGMLLKHQKPIIDELIFEKRKNKLYDIFKFKEGGISRQDNILEIMGTSILMDLKGRIIKKGSDFLSSVATSLNRYPPEIIDKWWEEL